MKPIAFFILAMLFGVAAVTLVGIHIAALIVPAITITHPGYAVFACISGIAAIICADCTGY